jgi:bifunctional ADP-heptose synthase (sugar kinase/adenylyltransferase)
MERIEKSESRYEYVKTIIKNRKKEWYKIFYIEWVFDCFHKWHKSFLEYIRKKAEKLYWKKVKIVVAVESDKLTKKKKWKNRPHENEQKRLQNVKQQKEVDLAFIKDRDIRYLLEDLTKLWIDYLIVPDE